jgi:hypothetical protein
MSGPSFPDPPPPGADDDGAGALDIDATPSPPSPFDEHPLTSANNTANTTSHHRRPIVGLPSSMVVSSTSGAIRRA